MIADEAGDATVRLEAPENKSLPAMLIVAELPQLRGKMGKAKSYAERLFDFPKIGPLSSDAASQSLSIPTQSQNVLWNTDALNRVVSSTKGYPYFLQEWGKHVWDIADASPITFMKRIMTELEI